MPDISNITYFSKLAGLGNNKVTSFSVTVPAQSIPANKAVVYSATTAISNSGSLAQIQYQLTGLETTTFVLTGTRIYIDGSGNFSVTSNFYFSNSSLFVRNFILNFTAAPLALPGFSVDCRAFLYDAPF